MCRGLQVSWGKQGPKCVASRGDDLRGWSVIKDLTVKARLSLSRVPTQHTLYSWAQRAVAMAEKPHEDSSGRRQYGADGRRRSQDLLVRGPWFHGLS